MNGKTGGDRGLRRAGALAVMAAVAVLTAPDFPDPRVNGQRPQRPRVSWDAPA